MLRVDPSLNHIPARREHVVSLFESINQPLVNIPNHGTAPTGAYLLGTRNEHGYYTVFVYLHQPETRAVIIYVSEPRNLTAEQFRIEESEAVRFVESMGFMIDSIHFRQLQATEQDAVIGRVPIFRPPPVTMDLLEVAEEVPLDRLPSDPIFGGIGPGGAEVFRRAGLVSQQQQQQQQPVVQKSASGTYGAYVPGATQPPPAPFGAQSPAGGLKIQATPGGSYSQPMGAPGSGPKPAMADPGDAAEALQRLGRLLAVFGLLLLLTVPPASACKSGGASDPNNASQVQSQVDVGVQQLASQHWADAITTFTEVLKEDPNDREALRGSGLAYMSLGRLEDAERYYRKAIESDPKWSIPKNELATLLISTRRCEEAEQLLRSVTEDIFYATPEFAEHNLSLALACEGKAVEAISRLENILLKRPQFCLGYLTLAQLSSQNKQPEKTVHACEDFENLCAKNEKIRALVTPDQTATCCLRSGMAYAQMGDVESARTSFMCCQSAESAIGKECRRSLEMLPQ
jgi:Tfp pilus assembly protein PilF